MKVRITVDAEVAAAAQWALAAHAMSVARHSDKHPDSPFDWSFHLKLANDQSAAFKRAVDDAELVDL